MMAVDIRDNNSGQITASFDDRVIRSWEYRNGDEQTNRMLRAHEFAEGWHQAIKLAPT